MQVILIVRSCMTCVKRGADHRRRVYAVESIRKFVCKIDVHKSWNVFRSPVGNSCRYSDNRRVFSNRTFRKFTSTPPGVGENFQLLHFVSAQDSANCFQLLAPSNSSRCVVYPVVAQKKPKLKRYESRSRNKIYLTTLSSCWFVSIVRGTFSLEIRVPLSTHDVAALQ